MFEVYDIETGKVIAMVDEPRYVYRSPKNGVWIRCDEQDAQAVAINGSRFALSDDDAPRVAIRKADAAARIRSLATQNIAHAESLEEVKAAYADLAEAVLDLYLNE